MYVLLHISYRISLDLELRNSEKIKHKALADKKKRASVNDTDALLIFSPRSIINLLILYNEVFNLPDGHQNHSLPCQELHVHLLMPEFPDGQFDTRWHRQFQLLAAIFLSISYPVYL